MSYWLGTLNLADGTTTVEAPVNQDSTDTVYCNSKDISSINVVWQSSFQPTAPALPIYMSDAAIGVISAEVWVQLNGKGTYHKGYVFVLDLERTYMYYGIYTYKRVNE